MADLYFTPATGHVVGTTYYAQAVREWDSFIWDGSNVTASPSYTDTDIALTEVNSMGVWAFAAPENLPAGAYMILCRKRAGGSPAATDDIVQVKRLRKSATGRVGEL